MIWFTFPVMRLNDSDESLGLAVESLSMSLLLIPKFGQLAFRAHLIHRALPASHATVENSCRYAGFLNPLVVTAIPSPRPIHRNDDRARSARHD